MILVTGATGNVGRVVLDKLSAAGQDVRALIRNPARASMPPGVEAVPGDLADPASLSAALSGVDRMFLLLPPGTHPAPVVETALRSGVAHITMLGSLTAQTHPDSPVGRGTLHAEQALRDSGLGWTALRAWEFASNTLAWAPSIRDTGVVEVPHGGLPSPVIDPADIASVAATVLAQADRGGHDGKIYPLTGPEDLTVADKVGMIAAALGRELKLEDHNDAQAAAEAMWLPGVCTIEGPGVLPTVEDITGTPARSFRQWANDHVHAFR
ncbi:NAD(P)H-binding protein [Amycolatopsis cynarae]|uniref:NAD(P)H-binding protein n=1 Tax=Amycolatopsis cynarae TaxID=2995223 RepID=A0ABY7AX44_9PSEU|nr:NAD(P)H-binding protein [Amycolatopsis sp. HUAS 11-8]WAL64521.1 NAD(P)H-binding protein [Amycolatopsis sp. HUAS 11-8]